MSVLTNLFENRIDPTEDEIFETILENPNVKIERISSKGHVSPPDFWYEQEKDEWVLILQGEAEIEFENGKKQLKKGEHLLLPKKVKHRVSMTSVDPICLWLAIHY